MKKSKFINFKNLTIIFLVILTFLELYSTYKIFISYKSIYQIEMAIPWIIFQPFLYKDVLVSMKNVPSKFKTIFSLRIVIVVLLTFILPSIVYFTLPKYTYTEGKHIVEKYIESDNKDYKFAEYSFRESTVPINNKQFLMGERTYYYGVQLTNSNKYFMVSPLTGKLIELRKDYWAKESKR